MNSLFVLWPRNVTLPVAFLFRTVTFMRMSSDNILLRQTEAHTHGTAKSLVSVNVRPHYPKVDVGSPAGLNVDSSWQYLAVVGSRIRERKSKGVKLPYISLYHKDVLYLYAWYRYMSDGI